MATRSKKSDKKRHIILFTGRKQAGKNTASEVLRDAGFLELSFAQEIKDVVLKQDPIIASELSYRDENGVTYTRNGLFRISDFIKVGYTLDKLKESHLEVRRLLQVTGTEVGRAIDPDLWVNLTKKKIEDNPDRDIAITDGRFPNERKIIGELGGKVIYVQNDKAEAVPVTHESEQHAGNLEEDYTIHNNGTVKELHEQVMNVMQDIESAS